LDGADPWHGLFARTAREEIMDGAEPGFQAAERSGQGESPQGTGRGAAARQFHRRFICADPLSKSLNQQVDALATRHTTILIVGESGVGKECVAHEIHDRSPRRNGPFVAVDCSSFSETLIESQLFGHVRGAFTGADCDRLGYIRDADGGTLFLDEVADMPLSLQTRLLRVLQERTVTPVGQTRPVPVDVRILAATHQDAAALVRIGRFREDLFYRLSAFRLDVPALRQRPGDIVPLAEYFLDLQAAIYEEPRRTLSEVAQQWLQSQEWRGNIRELANAIEYALVTSDQIELEPCDFPEPLLAGSQLDLESPLPAGYGTGTNVKSSVLTLREAQLQAVVNALRATGGDKTHAARLLAISRSRLYSILAQQGEADRSTGTRTA
jgi:DNA-binding NtrC family response regulator